MINNYLCESCSHSHLCKNKNYIDKFSEEAKKNIGVNITIDSCLSYEEDK